MTDGTAVMFEEFLRRVRQRVDASIEARDRFSAIEGPSFTWNGQVAAWRRRHQYATIGRLDRPGPLGDALLVLGRDATVDGPLGAGALPIQFRVEEGQIEGVAGQIVDHFAWPA
jgi:hypothetical protein